MTIREYIPQAAKTKIWLCPSTVYTPRFNAHPVFAGYECTKNTVPEEILDRDFCKHFVENGTDCIIWQNSVEFETELNAKKREISYTSTDS